MVDNMRRHKAKGRHIDCRGATLGGWNGFVLLRSAWLKLFAFCGFCLLPFSFASANEALRDPTRPPAALYTAEDAAEIETGPVLQSVRISQGRYTAVISGETVRVGGMYGDARVIKIRETEVVLKTGNSLQTLKLFPDVEKRPTANNRRNKR